MLVLDAPLSCLKLALTGWYEYLRAVNNGSKSVKRKERGGRTSVDAQHCATLRATLEELHWTEERMAEVGTRVVIVLAFNVAPPTFTSFSGTYVTWGCKYQPMGSTREFVLTFSSTRCCKVSLKPRDLRLKVVQSQPVFDAHKGTRQSRMTHCDHG